MIVAESDDGDGFHVLAREREMVRLGKSALGKGRLSKRAIRDGLETLLRMTTLARLKGASRVEAVATSAIREAANGAEFLEQVRVLTRLEVRTLSGDEEGALIFRAVQQAVDFGRGSSVLIDVGGGSTEWCAVRGGELRWVRSLEIGSLRGAELLEGDPLIPGVSLRDISWPQHGKLFHLGKHRTVRTVGDSGRSRPIGKSQQECRGLTLPGCYRIVTVSRPPYLLVGEGMRGQNLRGTAA
jgi:hypothetical protein